MSVWKKYRIRQNIEDRATKVTSQSVELEHSRVTYKWADKEVLTAREAAEYLGVSRKSIYRWTNQGILKPIMLPGGNLKIVMPDLIGHLIQNPHKLLAIP